MSFQPQEDDMYSGFEAPQETYQPEFSGAEYMQPPPGTAMRLGTGYQQGDMSDVPRPMTSNKGAGYSSQQMSAGAGGVFDPLHAAAQGPAPPLQQPSETGPEAKAQAIEREVHRLLEVAAEAAAAGRQADALEGAQSATKRERALCAYREKSDLQDQINFDLTFATTFTLAYAYQVNGMYSDALNTYSVAVRNKQYPQAGRLRVNMGNIYYAQRKFPAAIKMYRMAMDQIGSASKETRFRIMKNIGQAFVRLGQFPDAIQSFEAVMDTAPDAQTGFNLIVCYYALGDKEKLKRGFAQLLSVPQIEDDSEGAGEVDPSPTPASGSPAERRDELAREVAKRRRDFSRFVFMAARLVAPAIASDPESDAMSGYDWVIEHLKAPANSAQASSGTAVQVFAKLAMEMQIAKGIAYLKLKKFDMAIEVFKKFEKNERELLDRAATNLAFVYFL
eukprot:18353_1